MPTTGSAFRQYTPMELLEEGKVRRWSICATKSQIVWEASDRNKTTVSVQNNWV